jgi:S-adenosylmethionine:tRNA ribosyltransferase-isomerase
LNLNADLLKNLGNGMWRVKLNYKGSFEDSLEETGRTPLPPYIKRERLNDVSDSLDRERYQTVYASNNGAVAAPTAGFHFTDVLLKKTEQKGADLSFVTLHVGLGTFQPIRECDLEKHKIHKEYYNVTKNEAEKINRAYREKRRVISVGTTAARVLETITDNNKRISPGEGYTDLYIFPGYSFKSMDALITNFHLPMSSLLLLVSAFAGKDFIMNAYRVAVEEKYRFFSYGDAMLIL